MLEEIEKEWISSEIARRVAENTREQNQYISGEFKDIRALIDARNREIGEVSTQVNTHIKEDDDKWALNWKILWAGGTILLGLAVFATSGQWIKF